MAKYTIILEKQEEVKHRVQTESNTAVADRAAEYKFVLEFSFKD